MEFGLKTWLREHLQCLERVSMASTAGVRSVLATATPAVATLRRSAEMRFLLPPRLEKRRVPLAKRSRRQLGLTINTSRFVEEFDSRLRCTDPEQQKLLQEMFGKGAANGHNWNALFEAYGQISNPEPALSTAFLSLAEKCGKIKEAFDVYAELRRRKELTARMYTHMIRIAGRVHSAMAHAMLADMKVSHLDPNPPNYLALLEIYKKEKDTAGARTLWQQMRQDAVPGSEVMLCSVMSVIAKSGDVAGAEALLLEADCPIITAHFNCCLDACHVAGDADSAFRILEEMKAANCSPDVISYNSALGAIDRAKGGKEERDRLLQDMEKNEVQPNELFMERHIACVLRIPQQGVKLTSELIQNLPEEAQNEAREVLRQMDAANLRYTRLLREVKKLLVPGVPMYRGVPLKDWVKVRRKDDAGSMIEYFWDRGTGRTQWEHPECQVSETVAAFDALRPKHVAEVSMALGRPGSEVCMQYQMDSRNATSMASIITCAVMIARQEPRAPAHLWEVDWQHALGKELEPPEAFVQKLKETALLMAQGGAVSAEMCRGLWREMNRLPQVWQAAESSLQAQDLGRQSPELAGLEKLRLCVRAFSDIGAPSKET
eukprot:s200_g13.t2